VAHDREQTGHHYPDPTKEIPRFRNVGYRPTYEPLYPGPNIQQPGNDSDDNLLVLYGDGAPLLPGLLLPGLTSPLWKLPFCLPFQHLFQTHTEISVPECIPQPNMRPSTPDDNVDTDMQRDISDHSVSDHDGGGTSRAHKRGRLSGDQRSLKEKGQGRRRQRK